MDRLALSAMQKSFWFLSILNEGSQDNIVRFSLRINVVLSPERLVAALNRIIAENYFLGVIFQEDSGAPYIKKASSDLEAVQPELLADELLLKEAVSRFVSGTSGIPLDQFPLFRYKLLHLGGRESVILFAFHHIIFDGPSIVVFTRQLLHAFSGGPRPAGPLPDAAKADEAVSRIIANKFRENTAFWGSYLEKGQQSPQVFTGSGSSAGDVFYINLDKGDMSGFLALAESLNTTPYFAFLFVFSLGISTYFGLNKFNIITPVSMRFSPDIQKCIGCMINSVPIRADRAAGDSVADYAERFLNSAALALTHRVYPFHNIIEAAMPDRVPGRNPLSDFLISYQKSPFLNFSEGGFEAAIHPLDESPGSFVLVIDGIESGDAGVSVRVLCQKGLFDAQDVRNFEGIVRDLFTNDGLSRKASRPAVTTYVRHDTAGIPRNRPVAGQAEGTARNNYIQAEALQFWKQLLNNSEINADSNFFRVGGTSLKALQFLAWTQKMGLAISLLDFFKKPTIKALYDGIAAAAAPEKVVSRAELEALNGPDSPPGPAGR